ncbi:MAG TPA: hypothetical protein VK528_04380 [Flavobacterium sp.]|nr:hypothetical protein [Flavobacterium sp.]
MKLLKISAMMVFLLFISCDKNNIYSKFDKGFEENRWSKADVKTYDFTIEDETKSYDLILEFSHIAGFQFDSIPLVIEIKNPDNSKTIRSIALQITDAQGKDLGDCGGDYCDLSEIIFQDKKLAAGSYQVTVANDFNNAYLPNVLGVGIKVNISGK